MTRTENRTRILVAGGLSLANIVLVASLALAGLGAPAHAQGQNKAPVAKTSKTYGCPSGWSSTKNSETDTSMCFPQGTLSPKIYAKKEKETCVDGYVEEQRIWCTTKGAKSQSASSSSKPAAESKSASSSASASTSSGPSTPAADRLVSYGTIAKASPLDRCPLGYYSKSDMTECTTRFSPAPRSRKNTGGCNADEIDEWGLYCTADAKAITRAQAEAEAVRDFNQIYTANRGKYPAQGGDTKDYPAMVAAYGPSGSAQASSSATSSGDQAAAQTAQCSTDSGSAAGAAIGGAVAGDAGAALGGMLGGLGKKKKKKTC